MKFWKNIVKYIFIDSGIVNHDSVLVSLPEKEIVIMCAICTLVTLDYRNSFIHNLNIDFDNHVGKYKKRMCCVKCQTYMITSCFARTIRSSAILMLSLLDNSG